ncbi:hypothetical protein [Methylocystis parvus]|uniref:hypothetical protein n=1 Tax=Methylocystis parvus TaxID=134 RepID=UPI003C74F32C
MTLNNGFPAPAWARAFPAALGLFFVAAPLFAFHLSPGFASLLALVALAKWRLRRRLRRRWLVEVLTALGVVGVSIALFGARIDGAIACFFAFFTLGVWSGGFELIRVAIEGEAQSWALREGAIEIDRRNLLGEGKTIIRAADLAESLVCVREQDDGPDTYSVALRLKSGEAFETRGFATRQVAEKQLARLRGVLGLT